MPLTKEKLSRKTWKKQDFLLLNDTALLYSWAPWLCWSGRRPLQDNWGWVIARVSCRKDWSLVWSAYQASCCRSRLIHVRTLPAKPSLELIWFSRTGTAGNLTSIWDQRVSYLRQSNELPLAQTSICLDFIPTRCLRIIMWRKHCFFPIISSTGATQPSAHTGPPTDSADKPR